MRSLFFHAAYAIFAASFIAAQDSAIPFVRVQAIFGAGDAPIQKDIPIDGKTHELQVSEKVDVRFLVNPPSGAGCVVFDGERQVGNVPDVFDKITSIGCSVGGSVSPPSAPSDNGGSTGQSLRVEASFGVDGAIQRDIPIDGSLTSVIINEAGSIGFFGGNTPPAGVVCTVFNGQTSIGNVPTRFSAMTSIRCSTGDQPIQNPGPSDQPNTPSTPPNNPTSGGQTVGIEVQFSPDRVITKDIPVTGGITDFQINEPGQIRFRDGQTPAGVVCDIFRGSAQIGNIPQSFNAITSIRCSTGDQPLQFPPQDNGGSGGSPNTPPRNDPVPTQTTVRVEASFGVDGAIQRDITANGRLESFIINEPGQVSFFNGQAPQGITCNLFRGTGMIGTVPGSFNSVTNIQCIKDNSGPNQPGTPGSPPNNPNTPSPPPSSPNQPGTPGAPPNNPNNPSPPPSSPNQPVPPGNPNPAPGSSSTPSPNGGNSGITANLQVETHRQTEFFNERIPVDGQRHKIEHQYAVSITLSNVDGGNVGEVACAVFRDGDQVGTVTGTQPLMLVQDEQGQGWPRGPWGDHGKPGMGPWSGGSNPVPWQWHGGPAGNGNGPWRGPGGSGPWHGGPPGGNGGSDHGKWGRRVSEVRCDRVVV
jgi:hypothetical protein